MFWLISFTISWGLWLMFADKKRWRELFPVSFIAMAYALTTDVIMHYYPLWVYDDQKTVIPELVNAFGIYPVVTYLFIQWLPQKKTFLRMLWYWFIWTGSMIAVELAHIKTGHMKYPLWWNIYHSYIANLFILWTFYKLYELFQFEKLSSVRKE